jgi:hypothetical protein
MIGFEHWNWENPVILTPPQQNAVGEQTMSISSCEDAEAKVKRVGSFHGLPLLASADYFLRRNSLCALFMCD